MGTSRKHHRFATFGLIACTLISIFRAGSSVVYASEATLEKTIVIGYNHVPPDTMHIEGAARGPANQYLERIVNRMGYKAKFKYLPLARLISQLNSNQIDMINRIGANPTLKIKPDVPFTATTPGILIAKKSGVKTWKELTERKGFRIGTKIGMPLTDHMKGVTDRIAYQPGTRALENAVLMAHHGRIDGIYSPALGELVVMAAELNILGDFIPLKLPDKPWNVYVAFSPTAHKKFYNAYLRALNAEQKVRPYHDIYRRFLKEFFPQMPIDVLNSLTRRAPISPP